MQVNGMLYGDREKVFIKILVTAICKLGSSSPVYNVYPIYPNVLKYWDT